jgi:hypothetical protein
MLILIVCLGAKGQITVKRTGVIGNQYTSINNVECIFDPAFEIKTATIVSEKMPNIRLPHLRWYATLTIS